MMCVLEDNVKCEVLKIIHAMVVRFIVIDNLSHAFVFDGSQMDNLQPEFFFLYRLSVFFSFLFAVFSSAGTVRTPIIVFSEFITFQREKLDDAI